MRVPMGGCLLVNLRQVSPTFFSLTVVLQFFTNKTVKPYLFRGEGEEKLFFF